jgi:hypothetical protein
MRIVTYGLGGYCEKCSDKHDHPLHNIVEEIEIPDPPATPLDSTGSLATLLVVTGALTLQDAANAVMLAPEQLVSEAQAWHVASLPPAKESKPK